MSPKNRWGLYWLGAVTAGLGGAMLAFQIDNVRIGAPQSGAGWSLGILMVIAGAYAFGWAQHERSWRWYDGGTTTQSTLSERIAEASKPSEGIASATLDPTLRSTLAEWGTVGGRHCWHDTGHGTTCMLARHHPGAHKPTDDEQIIVTRAGDGIEVSVPPGATTP